MATWRPPRTQKPGGVQSIWLQRVRHNRNNLAYTDTQSYNDLTNGVCWVGQKVHLGFSVRSFGRTRTHYFFANLVNGDLYWNMFLFEQQKIT